MRVVTIVSLGACALFGLGALVVAKTMMPNPAAAKVAAAPPVTGTPVVVAKMALKFGDKLDPSKIEILNLPSNAIPDGAFKTTAAVLSQDGGGPPVVLTPVSAREPLLPAKLSGPGARPSVAAEIADGMRAYTIKVTDVTGVGGHALPGDRVDVVLMRDLSSDGQHHNFVSEVVIQDVRVLGVDLNADLSSNKPATPNTATLEVSIPDAQKLAVAGDLGKLSLALRKTGSAEITKTAVMHTANIIGGAAEPRTARPRRMVMAAAAPAAAPMIAIVANTTHKDGAAGGRASRPAPAPAPKLVESAQGLTKADGSAVASLGSATAAQTNHAS